MGEDTRMMDTTRCGEEIGIDPSHLPPNPYLLLTPGPLSTSPRVRASLVRDWCTWDDDYNAIVREIRTRLERLADPRCRYAAVPLQGSGTYAVEAMIGSAVPRSGRLLVLSNGVYGQRAGRIANMLGIPVVVEDGDSTSVLDLNALRMEIADDPGITHVLAVHVETTTGIVNPVEEIASIVRAAGRSLLVDAMSSFGGVPFDAAAMGVEAFATSANKCLQGVPGIGIVMADKDRLPSWEARSTSLSLDVHDQWRAMEEGGGKWRFTSPTHVVRAFLQALRELEDEGGIGARHARYRENQRRLVSGYRELGFATVLPDALHSPVITSFLPGSVRDFSFPRFYERLKEEGFVLYPGKIGALDSFRVGSIGHVFPSDIDRLVGTTRRVLEGRPRSHGPFRAHAEDKGIQALLLDWAGTAVDYGSIAPVEAFVRVFAARGIALDRVEARGPMGVSKFDHVKAILALDGVANRWRERHGRDPDERDAVSIHDDLEPAMTGLVAETSQLIPGHLELLDWARGKGIPIATGSGYTRSMMEPLLESARAQGYVPDSLVLPEDVGAGRPSPLMAYASACRLGRWPLSHFVKIGDTPADMREGRAAGCWCVGYSRCGNELGLSPEEDLSLPDDRRAELLERASERLRSAGAHQVVEGPWEVLAVLEEIDARLRAGERPPTSLQDHAPWSGERAGNRHPTPLKHVLARFGRR